MSIYCSITARMCFPTSTCEDHGHGVQCQHVHISKPPAQSPSNLQARNGSLFPSAAITLYVTYLGYSALQSEPHEYECNGVGHRITAASATTLALGMLLTLLSVVYSALRAGSNTQTFLTSNPGSPTGRDMEEALLDQGTSAGLDGAPDAQTMSAGECLKALPSPLC